MNRERDEVSAEAVRAAAEKMGRDLRSARQARNWTQGDAAWRSSMSLPTYKRMEAGDPRVAMTFWLRAWRQVGLLESVVEAGAPHRDAFGERLRGLQRATARVKRPSQRPEDWDY